MTATRRTLTFPRTRRLTSSSEFARVKLEGRSVTGRFLVLGYLTGQGDGPFRAGIVTAKRIGAAVTRNRVRRRIRDVVRTNQDCVCNGVWVVAIARPSAASASHTMLRDEWLRLVQRASILAP